MLYIFFVIDLNIVLYWDVVIIGKFVDFVLLNKLLINLNLINVFSKDIV